MGGRHRAVGCLAPSSDPIRHSEHPFDEHGRDASHMCSRRGYKTVMRFFPHQVSDLEPALAILERLNAEVRLADVLPAWHLVTPLADFGTVLVPERLYCC